MCEYSEICKNTFFTEHLQTTASDKTCVGCSTINQQSVKEVLLKNILKEKSVRTLYQEEHFMEKGDQHLINIGKRYLLWLKSKSRKSATDLMVDPYEGIKIVIDYDDDSTHNKR